MAKIVKNTRSYKLQILPNFHKQEEIRYNAQIYQKYTQHFLTQLYFSDKKRLSSVGMGQLADRAQKQAGDILSAHRTAIKATGMKSNIPQIKQLATPAVLRLSNGTTYDYWITLTSQWKNKIRIPAKSHKCLNKALKDDWKLSTHCEIVCENGKWFCRVFVTRPKPKASPKVKSIGIDVGLRHGVARSDNYLGQNLSKLIKKELNKQKDRQRNKVKKKPFKSKIKQVLDREVNRVIGRSKTLSTNISIENPKTIANLRARGLSNWARCYFANRLQVRASEEGIWVNEVWPAYTSQTCSVCKTIDSKSRVNRSAFRCTSCKSEFHADINAARNIARIGQERLRNKLMKSL